MITNQLRLAEDNDYLKRTQHTKEYILNSEVAFRNLLIQLKKKGLEIDQVLDINNGRYRIIKASDKNNLLILFKRCPYYEFGRRFVSPKSKDVGDTINSNDLKKASDMGIKKIYSIFSSGDVYSIDFDEFVSKSEVWVNNKGKRVRSINLKDYKKEFELGV